MNKFKISIIILSLVVFGLGAGYAQAQSNPSDRSAKAIVTKVIDEKTVTRENKQEARQQNLELEISSGELNGQKININNIGNLDVINTNIYKVGDNVYVGYMQDESGQNVFHITDYNRTPILFLVAGLFCLIIIIVGAKKGLTSIISLALSFAVIMVVLVPLVFKGYNPLLVGIAVSFLMVLPIVYITEGWSRKSHVAVISIFISLIIAGILSLVFSAWSRLTGHSQEEVAYLIESARYAINFKDLLLASFIIGTLGIIDDLVISQVETVEQIKEANPSLSTKKVYSMAMSVGRSHLGSMTNTLFLVYAGASFPLLMLININNPPFLTWVQAINNEEIATEIIRTFVGATSLCLSVPIATWLAAKYIIKQSKSNNI